MWNEVSFVLSSGIHLQAYKEQEREQIQRAPMIKVVMLFDELSLCLFSRPLSMAENLAKLAHKIDFASQSTDAESPEKETPETEDKEGTTSFQQPQWPWDSVRNQVRWVLHDN